MSNPEFDWTTILPEDERRKVLADTQAFFDSFPTRDEIEQAGREGREVFAKACHEVAYVRGLEIRIEALEAALREILWHDPQSPAAAAARAALDKDAGK